MNFARSAALPAAVIVVVITFHLGCAATGGPGPASAKVPATESRTVTASPAIALAAPAGIDSPISAAPGGAPASPADAWKERSLGDPIGVVPMALVRGLADVDAQARTLPRGLDTAAAAGVDASAIPAGWLHGALPVTREESVALAVQPDRQALVLDMNRDGILELSERIARAETWGNMAWFGGDVPVRQLVGGKPVQCPVPVRIGVMLQAPRMASRLDGRREGVVSFGGREHRVAIVDNTFRGWFSHPGIDSLMVDVDGDGKFDSSPDSSERYRLGEPFPLGDADAIVASVAPFGSSLTIARSTTPAMRKASLRIGSAAPSFEATTLDGKPIGSTSLKGKWVLLDFWATWCGPCRNELPHLKELRRQHPDLVILGISGDDKAETVKQFVSAQSLDWPQVHAQARSLMQQYRVQGFPTSFLLAPDGTIAARDLRGPAISTQVGRLKDERKKG